MACSLWKLCTPSANVAPILATQIRHGHHLRGKPPGVARSLKQRLEECNKTDPTIHFRVDIGLPPSTGSKKQILQERLKLLKAHKKDAQMEKLARTNNLTIDLHEVKQEWLKTCGHHHIKEIADHFDVYKHLYGDAYFYPRVPLHVLYSGKEVQHPVYHGNVLKPSDAATKPDVSYSSDDKTLWTLVLTNPDGHFTEQDQEYVHWFVGNIPGNKVAQGETLVEYMQPIPPKGTGYHRHIFILYQQNKKIDFSKYKKEGSCVSLAERTFSTYNFYKNLQDDLTPAGLAFFQADWDASLKNFYHNVLQMKEPIFEYDFPKPYIRKQEWFPLRKPFNLYMDKYRDPKQINKEFLERKLKNVHPFKPAAPPLPYPNAQFFEGYVPTWLKLEKTKSRLRWGRINDIE